MESARAAAEAWRPRRSRTRSCAALRDGVEDIYPGDVAQDIVTRFRESQKVLERELWDQ